MNSVPPLNRRLQDMLAESQYWPPGQMQAYQRSQLASLLAHAKDNVPFYKTRLDALFGKSGAIEWDRWHGLPILTRAEVKEGGAGLLPKTLPNGHGPAYESASSGTTGTPVIIHSTQLMLMAGSSAFSRACRWYGGTAGDRFCISVNPTGLDALDRKVWAVANQASDVIEGNLSSGRLAVGQSWPPQHILSFMERHRSTCFSGVSTTLEDIAAAQVESPARINLKFLVGISMALTERSRLLARQAFKAPAFSAYSSKEAHKIAHECPASGGFHVNSELVLVEIVDDRGRPCGEGESGRVIVTPFLSTAQPLIRYEQGDIATWGKPCACGRSLPVLAQIQGRIRNRFQFPGGHKFTPAVNYEPYLDLLKADKWQVAQTGPCAIEVRFTSAAPADTIDYAGMTEIYRKAFHPDLAVTYRKLGSIPLTAAGKFIDYVNEYEAQSA